MPGLKNRDLDDGVLPSKHRDWGDYLDLRVKLNREQQILDDCELRRVRRKIPAIINAGTLMFEANSPSPRMIRMYILHVTLGWNAAQVGRVMDCHRTLISHYCRKIEDARDDRLFDEALENIEENVRNALQRSLRDGEGASSDA